MTRRERFSEKQIRNCFTCISMSAQKCTEQMSLRAYVSSLRLIIGMRDFNAAVLCPMPLINTPLWRDVNDFEIKKGGKDFKFE